MIETTIHTNVEVAVLQKGKNGSSRCGDGYITIETDDFFLCALADGLGSGEGAYRSSKLAMDVIEEHKEESIPFILDACNKALASERGAVLTILKAHYDSETLMYGNVGNIATYFFTRDNKVYRPIPTTGYLSGRKHYQYKIEHYPFHQGLNFIMHSDGISMPRRNQEWINRSFTPHASIKQIEKSTKDLNDDLTVLIGRVN